MSPARARTSFAAIVGAGRALLETGGLDAVTMQRVADAVGVRAPSLYKRFAGRQALMQAIADDVAAELGAATAPALEIEDPADAVRVLADRYRAFAHRSPGAYQLLFTMLLPDAAPAAEANAAAAAGLLALTERLVGSERALEAARLLTAFAHGFRQHGARGRIPTWRRRRRGVRLRDRRDPRWAPGRSFGAVTGAARGLAA